jgi:hypothetical protein
MYDAHSLRSTDQMSRSQRSNRLPNDEPVSNFATENSLDSKIGVGIR